jgi:hypothetical protein
MKHYLPRIAKSRGLALRIPAFHAVPVRPRSDGWTPLRQAEFIGHLAETRSVAKASRAVSMGRESAYRLRTKPGAEGFNAAWDVALARLGTAKGKAQWLAAREAARTALTPHRKVTLPQLEWRVETGIWHVILRGGRYCGVRRKADNRALLTILSRVSVPERDDILELYC